MRTLVALAAVLALAAPAFAQSSDEDFASSLQLIDDAAFRRPAGFKGRPRFQRVTQEIGPDDPLLLAQKPLIALIKKVQPSVAFLMMSVPNEQNPAKPDHSTCTGFFTDALQELGRPSIITTNAHCVEKLAIGAEISVGLYDGTDNRPTMTKGKVLAYGASNMAKDIAFVELLDKSLDRPPLPIWTKLDKGETVIAIGNPHGLTFSVSQGIVSALGRDRLEAEFVLDLNQSDAAVNHGNSGGPLFNMWGSVIGINSIIVTQSGGFDGISMSVPAGYITLAMQQYRRTGDLKCGMMQLEVSASMTTRTLTAGKASPGGPAAAAQIQPGDQLVAVDDVDLAAMDPEDALKAFLVYVKYHSPGETITVKIKRDGQDVTTQVTLVEATPPEPPRPEWAPIPPKPGKSDPASFVTL
jgi:S1-C subfamily serine protease